MATSAHSHRQQGIALVIALIMLIVITLIGLSAARFTSIESRIASNDQTHVETIESVQSILDATLSDANNTVILGADGSTNCTPTLTCNANTITLAGGIFASEVAAGKATSAVTLVSSNAPVPRGLGYSVDCFSAASFSASATYDRASEGRGKSTTNQGVVVIYSNGGC